MNIFKYGICLLTSVVSLFSYSAAVKWSSGSTIESPKFLAPGDVKMTAAMNYTINVYFYSDAEGKNQIISSTTSLTAAIGGFTTTTTDSFDASTVEKVHTYYVKAIVENEDYIRSTDVLSFKTPGTGNAVINFMTGTGLTNPSGGSNTWGDWTEKGGDVPEPTTCSLLLVGLAGMGLKKLRKRNKQA